MTADQNVYGFTTSVDTHLIKNTEWGAVIYLAYSDYGFKGNKKFNLEEIYTNNSKTTHITGRSSGGESDNFQYGNYGYNGYKCNNTTYATNCYTSGELGKGTGASSTSNIYGVYDLFNSTSSGPLVMIAYKSKLYETIDIPTWSGSVSNPYPDKKYYDEYIYDSRNNNNYYVDNKKYGDATWESFDAQIISTRQSPRDMGYYLHRSGHPLNYSFKNSVSSFAYLRVVLVNN